VLELLGEQRWNLVPAAEYKASAASTGTLTIVPA
jgi:hypothetical protein